MEVWVVLDPFEGCDCDSVWWDELDARRRCAELQSASPDTQVVRMVVK